MNKAYKIAIEKREADKLFRKYSNFVSKKDIGKILSISLKKPEEKLENIIEDYLEKKYAVDKIETILESSKQGSATYNDIWRKLGVSRSIFYFRLNYIKRFVLKKRIEWVIEKGRIAKKNKFSFNDASVRRMLRKRDSNRKLLFNPGPVMTTETVKAALIQHDICHRDTSFEDLMKQLKKNSLKVFKGNKNHSVLFISGSGTSGLEAAISSSIPKNKKILILSNGAFGQRLFEIAKLHKINIVLIKKPWGELFNMDEIENALKKEKDIFAISMNHHETSVGILNPVNEVGKLAKEYNKLFIVDAISSLGAEDLSVVRDNIDICISSANKCLHSFSGISLICVSNRTWELIKDVEPRSFYLDLKKYYTYSEELNQTPYTPAVSNLFALDRAIIELLDEGLKSRQMRYIELHTILKSELSKLGFEFFIDYECGSHSILNIKVPEGINFQKFYDKIKEEGFIIYGCKPPLKDKYFQIANMGALRRGMVYDLIFTIEKVLKKMRRK